MGKAMNYSLWTVQVLLALLFLFAGAMKLVSPIEQLAGPIAMAEWFIRFIGVVEVLGGLGLILPGVFKFKPFLTPLAALGLLIIMIGAVIITVISMPITTAIIPFVTGLFAGFVAYGRWKYDSN